MPIPAFRNGDFSALLGAQIGTDASVQADSAQGRFMIRLRTRQVDGDLRSHTTTSHGGQLCTFAIPSPGIILPTRTNGHQSDWPEAGQLLPGADQQCSWRITGVPQAFGGTTRTSIAAALTTTSATIPGSTDGSRGSRNSKTKSPTYFGADNPAGPGQRNPNNRWNVAVGVSHVFTPTFTMSANVGGMNWVEGNDMQSFGFQALVPWVAVFH